MKKITVISFLLFSIIGCKKSLQLEIEKNVVQHNIPSFESLINFTDDSNVSGKFMIATSSPLREKNATNLKIHINGAFINKNTKSAESGSTNSFNGIEINCNQTDYSYDKILNWEVGKILFGKNLKMILRKNSSNFIADTVVNFNGGYIPEIFICSNNFQDGVTNQNSQYVNGDKLRPTYVFNWNADSLNRNGVFIYVEYNPKFYGNEAFLNTNPNRVSNAIFVDDNGSYKLTSELFDDIPLNSVVEVYIGRGNFGYITTENGTLSDMQITALSYQYNQFFYK